MQGGGGVAGGRLRRDDILELILPYGAVGHYRVEDIVGDEFLVRPTGDAPGLRIAETYVGAVPARGEGWAVSVQRSGTEHGTAWLRGQLVAPSRPPGR